MMRLSLRLLGRDWRSGELRVLLLALLIAVTCVTSVSFFTSRIGQALRYQSSELLGADLRLVADHPIKAIAYRYASQNNLRTAETNSFRSMVLSKGRPLLVEIKAAGVGYPLRGQLRIASNRFVSDKQTRQLPESGEAWADLRLLQKLGISVGDSIQVGKLNVRVSALLSYEPDRSGDMFSLAPRLLINIKDLPRTGLDQEGSRIRYSLLLAGDQNKVDKYRKQIEPQLARGERIEGTKDARREIRIALTRAQQFLGLAAVVAVVLACVAIAMASRRYSQRHLDTCAMLRCLGVRQNQLVLLFILQLLVLGLLAGLLGVILGYFAQAVLTKFLGSLVLVSLPQPSATPILIGMGISFGGLIGFALPPILQLRNVPTLQVLNRNTGSGSVAIKPSNFTSYTFGITAIVILVMVQAGEQKLGLWMLLGLAVTASVLWLVSALLILVIRRISQYGGTTWRFGLVNITRRAKSSIGQIMAFGIGIMVLLLLTIVRGDILRGWAEGIPDDAPNRFVINIQPDQLTEVRQYLLQNNLKNAALFPMVRGRLAGINGISIKSSDYLDQRTKNLVNREFNLSWASQLQQDNTIVKGKWWSEEDVGRHYFSVEEDIAKALGVTVGDKLTYNIAGNELTAKITSLRTVRWDSMRANFFVLSPPGVLDDYPASYITSFYLSGEKATVLDGLIRQFPNLTVIDIAAILSQIRLIIDRVSLAVEYVFAFTLAAGLTVMYAAIQSTLDERIRENAIMRALGARRRRLWLGLAVEFTTMGSLAGLLAAILASILGMGIANYVLELDYITSPSLWLSGLLLGGVGVGVAGVFGARQVLNSPPLTVLRR